MFNCEDSPIESFQFLPDNAASDELSCAANAVQVQPTPSMEYLNQLLQDKFRLEQICGPTARLRPPLIFYHLPRLLDYEIDRTRRAVFQLSLVEPGLCSHEIEGAWDTGTGVNAGRGDADVNEHCAGGPVVRLTTKLYIPVEMDPKFNYIGRILGPRGSTVKQLEQQTGCKILVRGGETRRSRPSPNSVTSRGFGRKAGGTDDASDSTSSSLIDEPAEDRLHVLITAQDVHEVARQKLGAAAERIRRLLVPPPEGMDELKKHQLIELAIINGTYRLPPVLRRAATLPIGQRYPGAAFGARPPGSTKRQSAGAEPGPTTSAKPPRFPPPSNENQSGNYRKLWSKSPCTFSNEPIMAEDLVAKAEFDVGSANENGHAEAFGGASKAAAGGASKTQQKQAPPSVSYVGHTVHPSGLVTFHYDYEGSNA